jgi:hypothetical protein
MPARQNIAVKYVALGLAVALFLGLTVWLISSEGRRTRESIREAAREAGSEVRRGIVEGMDRAVDRAAELPGKAVHGVQSELKATVAEGTVKAGKVFRKATDILGDNSGKECRPGVEAGKPTPPAVGEVRRYPCHAGEIRRLAVSPNGRTLLAASRDGLVNVYNVRTGREVCQLKGHMGQVNAVAFCPGGTRAVSGG